MTDVNAKIVEALKANVRVNTSTKSVEIYNDYGVKVVLTDLDADTYAAFESSFVNF